MSSDRLTLSQVALLTAYALGMAGGQLLFKAAAVRYGSAGGSAAERLVALLVNGHFLAALALYGLLAALWVWVLTFTPLSRAYPFVALAFALTPGLAALVFGESLSPRLIIGTLLIVCGLVFVMS